MLALGGPGCKTADPCHLYHRWWLQCFLCFFMRMSKFFYTLLGRAWFSGRCWAAAIRLSHGPEPLGRAVSGEVDALDIGGRYGRRFVLLRHTHRPQMRPCPIYTSRSGNVRHRYGGGLAGPRLLLGGSFRVCVYHRGGLSHFFRLRVCSCSTTFKSGSGSGYSSNLIIRLLFWLWLQSSIQP